MSKMTEFLREMETILSLLSQEVKDSPHPLSKEDYNHVVAIRDYCNAIIEEEIGK